MTTSASGIEVVLIAGVGTMGQYIAAHCVHRGFEVRLFDTNPDALATAAEAKTLVSQPYGHGAEWIERRQEILCRLVVQTDLATAAAGVDLVIECVPERLGLKKDFFRTISRLCPSPVILASNSSILLPSQLADAVEDPARFAALHFLINVPIVEVMGHPRTDPDVIRRLERFGRKIEHLPITLRQENSGHVMNSLLAPLIHSAISLAANGLASVEDIDRVWMIGMKAPFGPFGILDAIGLQTVLEITQLNATLRGDPQLKRNVEFLTQYVREGRLGIKTKGAFYQYPNPAYLHPDFLKFDPLPGPQPNRGSASCASHRPLALLQPRTAEGPAAFIFRLDPQLDGFWRDHVVKETPLLPAAAVIEMAAEAVSVNRAALAICFKNVAFVNGVRSFNAQPQTLFIEFDGDRFALFQEFHNQAGKLVDPRRLCVSGQIAAPETMPAGPAAWPDGAAARVAYADAGPLHFGPTMRGLRTIVLGDREGWGEIVAEPMASLCPDRASREFVHSIPLIDAALVCCNLFTEHALDGAWQIPVAADRVQLGRAPHDGETCRVWFRAVRLSVREPETEYVLSVFGADGACLLHLSGYRCRVMRTEQRSGLRLDFLSHGAATKRAASHVADLFRLELKEAPRTSPPGKGWSRATRRAFILGDNADAAALQRALAERDVAATLLPTRGPLAETLAAIDAAWTQEPVLTMFIVTGRDADAAHALDDPAGWRSRRERGIERPYFVCQRWIQLLKESAVAGPFALIGVTALGGDFGFASRAAAVEGGAVAGLLKAVQVESKGKVLVKVIDADPETDSNTLAHFVLEELAVADAETEIAVRAGRRWVPRARRFHPSSYPQRTFPADGVCLVTGGARGVTAIAAFDLARRHRLRMQLIGSSPYRPVPDEWLNLDAAALQQALEREASCAGADRARAAADLSKRLEIHRTLWKYRQAGLHAEYHAADVADPSALKRVLEQIRAVHGPIAGLIHGAGVTHGGPLARQWAANVRRGFDVKLDSLVHLLWLTRDDPLQFIAGFGSTSGRFGAYCNADYSAANEALCKIVTAAKCWHPRAATLSFHWTAWDDAGMCLEPASRLALSLMKVRLMPADEGARHFCEALEAAADVNELLVTDHPNGVHSTHPLLAEVDRLR